MKTIINDDFLLESECARHLYHSYAEDMPIIDYHCHLNPAWIAEDHRFSDLGELLLSGDHYKWRAMRSFGIPEREVTGDASWREKFRAFARTLEWCVGNPLYHWTHLELKRYFGIDEALTEENADEIFDTATALLQTDGYSARGLIARSGVKVICTTDDPLDSLEHHLAIEKSGFETRVLPTYRPDKVVNIHKETFLPYIKETGASTFDELLSWLEGTLDKFAERGCLLSDHGLDFVPYKEGNAEQVFDKALRGEAITDDERDVYMTALLRFFAKEYARRGWCMQIHVGAIRNNNTRMYKALGPDTGYDSIAETSVAEPLAKLLDSLEEEDLLPKTILYSLNGKDNYPLATLMGCFQGDGIRSKIQLGSGWWFLDQKDGMEAQLRALGNLGVLGAFVGMLTDSRSFVSYPRHEYFRRILCNLIGGWVESGLYPRNEKMLEKIIRGICYDNARGYFNFN